MSVVSEETEGIEWPELPEEFFWRIREGEFFTDSLMSKDPCPAVYLVKIVETTEKPKTKAFTDDLKVTGEPGNWELELDNYTFPPHGSFKREFTKENIEESAVYLWDTYNKRNAMQLKLAEDARKLKEAKERFYGDYR